VLAPFPSIQLPASSFAQPIHSGLAGAEIFPILLFLFVFPTRTFVLEVCIDGLLVVREEISISTSYTCYADSLVASYQRPCFLARAAHTRSTTYLIHEASPHRTDSARTNDNRIINLNRQACLLKHNLEHSMATAQSRLLKDDSKPTIINRVTRDGGKYTYEFKIIQQPRIARACGQGAKCRSRFSMRYRLI